MDLPRGGGIQRFLVQSLDMFRLFWWMELVGCVFLGVEDAIRCKTQLD